MLVLDSYKSYINAEFEDYYKENNIITICLLSYSSYLIQPLDVGCYSVLKKIYSVEIEHFIKAQIMYISKPEFFLAFRAVFYQTFTKENVLRGFRRARLIPYNL